MNQEFTRGQTVYNVDGRQAIYVTRVDGGHIVQPLYEDGDGVTEPGSYYAEGVDLWTAVHATAPREKLQADIAMATKKLAALRHEISEAEMQRLQSQRGQREVIERLKQHEALCYLDEFLNAQITHYVLQDEGQWVVMDSAAFNATRSVGYSERVLSLYARVNSKGTALSWQVKHSDIGGREIFAFPDANKAVAKLQEIVTAQMQEVVSTLRRGGTVYNDASLIKHVLALGMQPLPELVELLRARDTKAAQEALKAAQDAAAKAQQKLAALEAATA